MLHLLQIERIGDRLKAVRYCHRSFYSLFLIIRTILEFVTKTNDTETSAFSACNLQVPTLVETHRKGSVFRHFSAAIRPLNLQKDLVSLETVQSGYLSPCSASREGGIVRKSVNPFPGSSRKQRLVKPAERILFADTPTVPKHPIQ